MHFHSDTAICTPLLPPPHISNLWWLSVLQPLVPPSRTIQTPPLGPAMVSAIWCVRVHFSTVLYPHAPPGLTITFWRIHILSSTVIRPLALAWSDNHISPLSGHIGPSTAISWSDHSPSPLSDAYRLTPPLWSNIRHPPGLTITHLHSLNVDSCTVLGPPQSTCMLLV